MDVERMERLAVAACRGWWGPWRDDLLQVARLAVWTAGDVPDGWAARKARSAVVDEARRIFGRDRDGVREPQPLPMTDGRDAVVFDEDDPTIGLPLDGEAAMLVEALAQGWAKVDVADALGVTPGAVSHRLTAIRRRLPRSAITG